MTISAYKSYKPSGIEWLGDIPEHWQTCRIRHLFSIRKVIAGELGHDILAITQKGVKLKDIESGDGQLSMDYSKYQLVERGDFAMNHMDLLTGYIDISQHAGVTSPDYRVFRSVSNEIDPGYYLYALQLCYKQKIFYKFGQGSSMFGRWRLPAEQFKQFPLPRPCLTEQKAIAAFLDRETLRIDRLIEKQEQLIKLLEEKRQAEISHAVTKGLDPNAPMKDSGIEWLGAVPANWEINKLGWFSNVGNGCTPSRTEERFWDSADFGWLNSSKINDEVVHDAEQFVSNKALRQCALPKLLPGDVLVAITGEGKTRGMAAMLNCHATISQHLAYIRLARNAPIQADFLFRYLQGQYMHLRHISSGVGSTKAALTCGDLRAYKIPTPPLREQIEICKHIDNILAITAQTTEKLSQKVKLLKEHRSALISAAVTGKIDVRGLVDIESEEAA